MTWNGIEALEYNSIIPSNSATEQVYAYLLTHVGTRVSHSSKVKYATKKPQLERPKLTIYS